MDLNKLAHRKHAINRLDQAAVPKHFGKKSFDEIHKYITPYLHVDIYAAMSNLHEHDEITNITGFINAAIAEYREKHYAK